MAAKPPVSVWRISRATKEYAADDVTGKGAELYGGRWNIKGTPMVYASSSLPLALLETLAHLGPNGAAVRDRFIVEILVPPEIMAAAQTLNRHAIDPAWCAEPASASSQTLGNRWATALDSCLLIVPSVLLPEETNLLINPRHPAAKSIVSRTVRQYLPDPRLAN